MSHPVMRVASRRRDANRPPVKRRRRRVVVLSIFLFIVLLLVAALGVYAYKVVQPVTTVTGITAPRSAEELRLLHELEQLYHNIGSKSSGSLGSSIVTPKNLPISVPELNRTRRINILLLASDDDNKFTASKGYQFPLTQAMIILSLDPQHNTVTLLSISRDFYVPVTGHGMHKIDEASMLGNIALARDTVEKNFHIWIDNYAWLGLAGFVSIINAVGGVDIDSPFPILDDAYPNDVEAPGSPYTSRRLYIPAGAQHFDGLHALEYVRSRHGTLLQDFARSLHQQQVLVQLRHKLNGSQVLTQLPELASLLNQNIVRTDLTTEELTALALYARQYHPTITKQVVFTPPHFASEQVLANGEDVVIPNWSAINPVVADLLRPLDATSTAIPSQGVAPTQSTQRPQHTAMVEHKRVEVPSQTANQLNKAQGLTRIAILAPAVISHQATISTTKPLSGAIPAAVTPTAKTSTAVTGVASHTSHRDGIPPVATSLTATSPISAQLTTVMTPQQSVQALSKLRHIAYTSVHAPQAAGDHVVASSASSSKAATIFPGERLIFARQGNLYQADAGGVRLIGSFGDARDPQVSPDGQHIVFVRQRVNTSDIFLASLASITATQDSQTGPSAIGTLQTLTHSNVNPSYVPGNFWAASPAWSPDGTSLLYLTDRAKTPGATIPPVMAIWRLVISQQAISQQTLPNNWTGGDADPAWRPSAPGQFAFTRYTYDPSAPRISGQVMLDDPTSGTLTTLTSDTLGALQPAWSPNGQEMAMVVRQSDGDHLRVAVFSSPTATTMVQTMTLPLPAGLISHPVWAPDGHSLAFAMQSSGHFRVRVVPLTLGPDGHTLTMGAMQDIAGTEDVDAASSLSWVR